MNREEIENLRLLHKGEEQCRAQTITVLRKFPTSWDQVALIYDAMDVFDMARQQTANETSNILFAVSLLALRAFNASAAVIKLAFSGYYQPSISPLRDLLETTFLLDDFLNNPHHGVEWTNASIEAIDKKFWPQQVCKRLKEFEAHLYGASVAEQRYNVRSDFFDTLSHFGAHVRVDGTRLMLNTDNKAQCGPHFSEEPVLAIVTELTRLSGSCAVRISRHHKDTSDSRFAATVTHFSNSWKIWCGIVTQKGPQPDDPLNKVLGITPI